MTMPTVCPPLNSASSGAETFFVMTFEHVSADAEVNVQKFADSGDKLNDRPVSQANDRMNPLEISPDQFRHLAERITHLATDYLEHLDSVPVAPPVTGEESVRAFNTPLPEQGIGEAALDDLNHRTKDADIDAVIPEVLSAAKEVASSVASL
jgi:hypothetical protein